VEYRHELERMYKKRRDEKWLRPRFFLELLAYEIKVNTALLKSSLTAEAAEEISSELVVLSALFDKTSTFVNSVNRALYIDRYLKNKSKFHIPTKEATGNTPTQEFDPDDFFVMDQGGLPWARPPSGNDPIFKLFG
jgi:superfamily II DNA or RNA helicase